MKLSRPLQVAIALSFCLHLGAQTRRTPQVGPFGAIPPTRTAVKISSELQKQLPARAVPLVVRQTHLTREGETFIFYEVLDNRGLFPEAGTVVFAREDKVIRKLEIGEGCNYIDDASFAFSRGQGVALALMCSGDGSSIDFFLLGAVQDSYQVTLHKETDEGRMRIREGSAPELEIWSAREDLDGRESCTWCPHRYQLDRYVWRDSKFVKVGSSVTKESLNPASVIQEVLKVFAAPKS